MAKVLGKIICIFLFVFVMSVYCQDRTRELGAAGTDLAFSVIDQIVQSNIFPREFDILGPVSYVESLDGTNFDVVGEDGGFWKLDQGQFATTQNTAAYPVLSTKISAIQQRFGINWQTVTYDDLRRPLYSGLAAALFFSTTPGDIPETIEGQANYWKQYYDTPAGSGTVQKFLVIISSFPLDLAPDLNCPGNQRGVSTNIQQYASLSWTAPPNINAERSSFLGASDIYVAPGAAAMFKNEYTDNTNTVKTCAFAVSASANGPEISYCPFNLRYFTQPGVPFAFVSWSPPISTAPVAYRSRYPDETSIFLVGDSLVYYIFEERDVNNVVTGSSVCAFIVTVGSGSQMMNPVLKIGDEEEAPGSVTVWATGLTPNMDYCITVTRLFGNEVHPRHNFTARGFTYHTIIFNLTPGGIYSIQLFLKNPNGESILKDTVIVIG